MDKKSEMFDLKREKQELDVFLSSIVDTEAPVAVQSERPVQMDVPAPSFPDLSSEKIISFPSFGEEKKDDREVKRDDASGSRAPKEKTFSPELNEFFAKPSSDQGLPKMPVPSGSRREPAWSPEKTSILKADMEIPKEVAGLAQTGKPVLPGGKEVSVSDKAGDAGKRYDYAPEKSMASRRGGLIALFLILVLILVVAGYLWMYPERGYKTLDWIQSKVPAVGEFIGTAKAPEAVSEEIRLTDVRQKLIYNKAVGKSVRVIEGVAVNQLPHIVSRISIAAKLHDVQGAPLISMTSRAGNILTDEQLESLDVKTIATILQNPATAKSNIPPKEQVPFMVVITQEPAGVHKLSVESAGFDKN
ncbi:MAG: DUF3426 domain-containing protein [Smithellaceae bacterium]